MTIARDEDPQPLGELVLAQPALPRDSNGNNKVYAGWVVAQMDLAAAMTAQRVARAPISTVAIEGMDFVAPIKLGSSVSFYTRITNVGRTSVSVVVEVWAQPVQAAEQHKVTEAGFVLVAVDESGHTRLIEQA